LRLLLEFCNCFKENKKESSGATCGKLKRELVSNKSANAVIARGATAATSQQQR